MGTKEKCHGLKGNVNVEGDLSMRTAVFTKALIISIVLCLTIFFKVSTGHAFSVYDTDQDWKIGDFELLHTVDNWAGGGLVGNFGLLDVIEYWAFGSYCFDAAASIHKSRHTRCKRSLSWRYI